MNSLEHFNHYYSEEKLSAASGSLVSFYQKIVGPKLLELKGQSLEAIKVLELGCGSKSIFEDLNLKKSNIVAVDFSEVAIEKAKERTRKFSEIYYQVLDLTIENALQETQYDLIFDSHCLHCIEGIIERKQALENIHNALTGDGIFCAEMMVQPTKGNVTLPMKYIPTSMMLEQELLEAGFKISYFMIERALSFYNENSECDLLRVICRK